MNESNYMEEIVVHFSDLTLAKQMEILDAVNRDKRNGNPEAWKDSEVGIIYLF